MGEYKDNLSGEKKPFSLMPEGHRQVIVTEMIEGKSKSGNNMFTVTLEDIKTKTEMLVWLVNEPKKRWMLKSLLLAVELPAGEDGVYEWSKSDVIGKQVTAIVEHYSEPWINRDGVEVTSNKAKVTEFIPADITTNKEDVQWKD